MKLYKENIETLLRINEDYQLCNNHLFKHFFNKLKSIDENKINLDESSFKIVDENNKPLDISVSQLNTVKLEKLKYSYLIDLISKNNNSFPLSFNLWNSKINIYLGIHQIQYADDIEVQTQKELDEFDENLSLLLESKIVEELYYKNSKLKKIVYYFEINKTVKKINYSFNFTFLFTKIDKTVKNIFQPWIVKCKN